MKKITTIITLFIFCGIYGQSKRYILNQAHTDKIKKELKYPSSVYKVNKEILKHQKEAFIIDKTINISDLPGSFIELDEYSVIGDTHTLFSKHELVLQERMEKLKVSTKHVVLDDYKMLIKNITTGAYYLVKPNFLNTFDYTADYTSEQDKVFAKVYMAGKRKYAISRTVSAAYPAEKYKSMIEECKQLTYRLVYHGRLVEKGNMTKAQITNWKRDLVAAKLLDYRISEFNEAYGLKNLNEKTSKNNQFKDQYELFSTTLAIVGKGVKL